MTEDMRRLIDWIDQWDWAGMWARLVTARPVGPHSAIKYQMRA